MRIKIVCYNILNGFTGDNKPYILDNKRKNAAIKILERENPDILILCEGWFWPSTKKDNLKDFKKLINSLTKTSMPAENTFRYAPIVISKFPVIFQDLSEYHKKFIRCQITIKKKNLNLDVYHPSPDNLSEEEKASFLKKIIDKPRPNHILAGDFNTLSPEDKYDEKALITGFSRFMGNKAETKVKDLLKTQTVELALSRGFIDSYKIKKQKETYTVPTDFRSKDKISAIRIDYIFCSKDIKILDSGIIKNKLTEMASDHYPIYAVLEI